MSDKTTVAVNTGDSQGFRIEGAGGDPDWDIVAQPGTLTVYEIVQLRLLENIAQKLGDIGHALEAVYSELRKRQR